MKVWIASLLAPLAAPYYAGRFLYGKAFHLDKKLKTKEQNLILIKNKIDNQNKENTSADIIINSYNKMASELYVKLGHEEEKYKIYTDAVTYNEVNLATYVSQTYPLDLNCSKLGNNSQQICATLLALINKLYADAEKNPEQEAEKQFLQKAQEIILLATGTLDCLNEYRDYKYSVAGRAISLGGAGIIGSAVTMASINALLITALGASLTGGLFLGICLAIVVIALVVSAALVYHEKKQLEQTLMKSNAKNSSIIEYQNLAIQELESSVLVEQAKSISKYKTGGTEQNSPQNLYPNLVKSLQEVYQSESNSLSAIGLKL